MLFSTVKRFVISTFYSIFSIEILADFTCK